MHAVKTATNAMLANIVQSAVVIILSCSPDPIRAGRH
jgi:hypothetical protein